MDDIQKQFAQSIRDASEGIFTGYATNGSMPAAGELTLASLLKMKERMDAVYVANRLLGVDLHSFRHGADMSQATYDKMKESGKVLQLKPRSEGLSTMLNTGIEVHIVNDIPFGKVEECSCRERSKLT